MTYRARTHRTPSLSPMIVTRDSVSSTSSTLMSCTNSSITGVISIASRRKRFSQELDVTENGHKCEAYVAVQRREVVTSKFNKTKHRRVAVNYSCSLFRRAFRASEVLTTLRRDSGADQPLIYWRCGALAVIGQCSSLDFVGRSLRRSAPFSGAAQ